MAAAAVFLAAVAGTVPPLASSEAIAEPGFRRAAIPAGWADLCAREPGYCRHFNRVAAPPTLTPERRAELDAVNRAVNGAVSYVTDKDLLGREEFWSLPQNGKGDCEDIALEKRRRLMDAGWPRGSLLMTVVVAHNGQWHALLSVATDQGMLVLDNMTDEVLPPEETRHRFFSSQSPSHPNRWVMWDDRTVAAAKSPKRGVAAAATPQPSGGPAPAAVPQGSPAGAGAVPVSSPEPNSAGAL